METALRAAATRMESAVTTDEADAARADLDRARKGIEEFRIALYLQKPELRTRQADFAPAALRKVDATILLRAPGTAILSYAVLKDRCYLFVLYRDRLGVARLTLFRTAVDAVEMRSESDALWRSAGAPGGAFERPARALYKLLIEPAEPVLTRMRHLVIVPDAAAPSAPFAAMLDARGRTLIERWSVSYAPSVTALVRMVETARARGGRSSGMLAVGAPRFARGHSPLPATADEARRVAGLMGRATVLTGSAATRARVLKAGAAARFVHLATHGVLDERAPMQSAVVLTPAGTDDGLLRARDLADASLAADMVVLSACQTALGKHIGGEGVIGLTWALFVGGATSTVASQWQVYDESTRALMVEFYRRLGPASRAPVAKAEALRQAQLAVRRNPRYRHPYYWAAFMLSGVWLN
jgi:CHAT domain-containing protein